MNAMHTARHAGRSTAAMLATGWAMVLAGAWALFFAAAGVLLLPAPASAQSGGGYDLSWSTIDAGGATALTGGAYSLAGTAGQPDAGLLSGGGFTLEGGFWFGGAITTSVETLPGIETPSGPEAPSGAPTAYRLHDMVPNPFSPRTRIAFDTPRAGPVRLAVYDVRGALVRTLAEGVLPPGRHERYWDGLDDRGNPVASGVYMMQIEAEEFRARRKGVLLK